LTGRPAVPHAKLFAAIAVLPRMLGRLRRPGWINPDELKRRLEQGDDVVVIDVRGPDEFTGPLGHIATARNIPVAELDKRVAELAGLERKPIVLVCLTGKRSAVAAQILHAAGFSEVLVLRQGMRQWNAAGLPVNDQTVV
jgi:rhodanese-related sulfurtransferase